MTDPAGNLGRKEPRFQVKAPRSLLIRIEGVNGSAIDDSAELLDLSRGGLRLNVQRAFSQGDRLKVRIEAPGIDQVMQAKVCWTSPGPKHGWFLGCVLAEKIAQETIDELARAAIVERRRDSRQNIDLKGMARLELGSQSAEVQLVNYSAGGFCVVSAGDFGQEGDRLMIELDSQSSEHPITIRGKIEWSKTLAGGFSLGCSFVSRDDYSKLQQLVSPHSRSRWHQRIRRYRPTQWRTIAAAVLLILGFQMLHIARSRPDLVRQFDRAVIEPVGPWIQQISDALFPPTAIADEGGSVAQKPDSKRDPSQTSSPRP